MKSVSIPEDVSIYVEKTYFEWQALNNILAYITQQHGLDEHIEYYTKKAKEAYMICEFAKQEAIDTFIGSEKSIRYNFDFVNCKIEYEDEII